jgi:hypothetical protein
MLDAGCWRLDLSGGRFEEKRRQGWGTRRRGCAARGLADDGEHGHGAGVPLSTTDH